MAHYRIIDYRILAPPGTISLFTANSANPSFNLCVPIAAQRLYECAKDRRVSFFSARALVPCCARTNGVPQLRQRVRNDEVH